MEEPAGAPVRGRRLLRAVPLASRAARRRALRDHAAQSALGAHSPLLALGERAPEGASGAEEIEAPQRASRVEEMEAQQQASGAEQMDAPHGPLAGQNPETVPASPAKRVQGTCRGNRAKGPQRHTGDGTAAGHVAPETTGGECAQRFSGERATLRGAGEKTEQRAGGRSGGQSSGERGMGRGTRKRAMREAGTSMHVDGCFSSEKGPSSRSHSSRKSELDLQPREPGCLADLRDCGLPRGRPLMRDAGIQTDMPLEGTDQPKEAINRAGQIEDPAAPCGKPKDPSRRNVSAGRAGAVPMQEPDWEHTPHHLICDRVALTEQARPPPIALAKPFGQLPAGGDSGSTVPALAHLAEPLDLQCAAQHACDVRNALDGPVGTMGTTAHNDLRPAQGWPRNSVPMDEQAPQPELRPPYFNSSFQLTGEAREPSHGAQRAFPVHRFGARVDGSRLCTLFGRLR
jgi:hypothetical protein